MTRLILTNTRFDFEAIRSRAAADMKPAHLIDQLARELDAEVIQPAEPPVPSIDRVLSLIIGLPEQWTAVREALHVGRSGDLVYCDGEESGIAIALANLVRRRGLKVAIHVTTPEHRRTKYLLKLLVLVRAPILLMAGTQQKVDDLVAWLHLDRSHVVLMSVQVDESFFRPPSTAREPRDRPLLASCGMEQRDYETLAAAVRGQLIDLKVCAVSPNLRPNTQLRMPRSVPDNMEMRHYEFDELRALYWSADVTVISLLDHDYSAGLTVLLEALGCGSPVVMTKTPGLGADLIDAGIIVGAPPGDPAALWSAIRSVLDDPEATAARRERAVAYFREHFTSAARLEQLVRVLAEFESGEADHNHTTGVE